VTGDVADDMIVAEEPAEYSPVGFEDFDGEEEPLVGGIAQEEALPYDEAQRSGGDDELSVNMDDLEESAEGGDPAESGDESDEMIKIESESTEELSLVDFKE
jgi:hypothetical protein